MSFKKMHKLTPDLKNKRKKQHFNLNDQRLNNNYGWQEHHSASISLQTIKHEPFEPLSSQSVFTGQQKHSPYCGTVFQIEHIFIL